MLAVTIFALGYQAGTAPTRSAVRAPLVTMEDRLNNYVLPGPMKPLGNQVMVKPRKTDDKTMGGLFVPTGEVEVPKEGIVVMAGPGKAHPETGEIIPNPVKDGDLVLMGSYAGEKVDYNGEAHVFMDADLLLGSFEGNAMTIPSFRPLGDLIMVQMAEQAEETTTGIALAGLEEEESNSGEVVAAGPGRVANNGKLVPVMVSPGDSVMYSQRAGAEATVEGKMFMLVSEQDCLAKW